MWIKNHQFSLKVFSEIVLLFVHFHYQKLCFYECWFFHCLDKFFLLFPQNLFFCHFLDLLTILARKFFHSLTWLSFLRFCVCLLALGWSCIAENILHSHVKALCNFKLFISLFFFILIVFRPPSFNDFGEFLPFILDKANL